MDLSDLKSLIEARFECTCEIARAPDSLVVRVDTKLLPHSWELFQRYERGMIDAVTELIRTMSGLADDIRRLTLDIRHVAALPRYALVVTGVEGVVRALEAPLYFVRTEQLARFRPELLGIRWPL